MNSPERRRGEGLRPAAFADFTENDHAVFAVVLECLRTGASIDARLAGDANGPERLTEIGGQG